MVVEHTPGPWNAFANRVWGADDTIICTVSIGDMAQDNVNAKMLAASWDMKNALEDFINHHNCPALVCPVQDAALEALAKSKGEL